MSVVTLLVGGVAYGVYTYLKKKKFSKQFSSAKMSDQEIKEVANLKDRIEIFAICIYNNVKSSSDIFEELKIDDKETYLFYLIEINAAVYRMHSISGGGIYVTEKNLATALENLTPTQLCVHDSLGFFAISTAQGKVLYLKNEFYEDQETGQTHCVYTTIEHMEKHLSPIVGIGYTGQSQLFAVGYADGVLRMFDARRAEVLQELRTYQLGSVNIKSLNIYALGPIFATLNDNDEQQMWNIPKDNIAKCISQSPSKHLFDAEHKIYLNSAMLEKPLEDIIFYHIAINNTIEKKIELYAYRDTGYQSVVSIPYEGKITCSAFCQKQNMFAFYQKGGQKEGVHIWDVEHVVQGGYFTPASKNQQHPIQMSINKDKIFCLYEDGLMEMWHCQADRQAIARETLEKITQSLPYNLKVEFLRQFGMYLADRSSHNYHILVNIALAGMTKKDIEVQLMMLQFLNPDWINAINAEKNQNVSEE